jgi:hypothetical protein
VDLHEAELPPVLAHRVLDRALDFEDQPAVGPAQVQVAPVHPLLQRGLGAHGQFRLGGGLDVQGAQAHLDAAELHALVGDRLAGQDHGRLGRQRRDRVVERAWLLGLLQHHLSEAGAVSQDHELDPLLVAHRLHPALELDGLADVLAEL